MRLGVIPENEQERAAVELGVVPTPLFDTQIGLTQARVVMAATALGVFDALAAEARSASGVARRCGTDAVATEKLLIALMGAGYVQADDDAYHLTPAAHCWLGPDSPQSLRDLVLMMFDVWDLMAHAEDYLRTGKPYDLHDHMNDEQWKRYQRGMRALANPLAEETAALLPVAEEARLILDIGGSHGYYSVALCRRHPNLRAVVLDLPQAVKHAAPLLAAEGMGDRVVHRAGNALHDDLGIDTYDVALLAGVAHHFTDQQNRALTASAARALRPGGVFAVVEPFQPRTAADVGQFGALSEFCFGLTSRAGSWTANAIAGWQRAAGLVPQQPTTMPSGVVSIQAATKPVN